jgi:stalled ribosome rescue protein Dom34
MTSKHAGIWIDHRKAVIVTLDEAKQPIAVIESRAERHLERAGDSPLHGPYEAHQVPADDKQQRIFTAELNRYYDQVIGAVRHLNSLLIMGPGEAKTEFAKRLDQEHLSDHVVGIETVDKMTDMQIAAKVHKFFEGRHVG